jgi:hypothetical protein
METNSNFLTLNLRDFLKGLIVTVITAFIAYLQSIISSGSFDHFDLKTVGTATMSATIAYLTKNSLTNNQGEFMKRNPSQQEQI